MDEAGDEDEPGDGEEDAGEGTEEIDEATGRGADADLTEPLHGRHPG